jgi:hypothetical protein
VDDVPALSSSQATADSELAIDSDVDADMLQLPSPALRLTIPAMPLAANNLKTRKRVFSDATEAAQDIPAAYGSSPHEPAEWRERRDWLDGEVSPRSWSPAGWGNARVMAMPRRRRGKSAVASMISPEDSSTLSQLGQENMAVDVDDFEEANFLDERWGGMMEVE